MAGFFLRLGLVVVLAIVQQQQQGGGRLLIANALIPATPREQTTRAVSSIRKTIEGCKQNGKPLRIYVDYLIPLPPATQAEDIDPWPGGLAQMYPYAEEIVKAILREVVQDPKGGDNDDATGTGISSQVLSAPDCCGFFVQESTTSSSNDVAAIVFPGVDQLQSMEDIDQMVGPERTLLIFNKQFQRPIDFGFLGTKSERSKQLIFQKYTQGFAFQEFACRGEDLKLVFEYPNWTSSIICDNEQGKDEELFLLPPQLDRPEYEALEAKINEILPEPLWMRKMQEASAKGFKFQRGNDDEAGDGAAASADDKKTKSK
mmetsp:Transcript_49477/g.53396  ORF Transcript_49477/g.53396 Transcript_49477/m.53396 type:complete len:316 (-) Transcript_49477:58-1005(-)